MKILVGVLANDENGYDEMVQAARDTCYKNIPEEFEVFYLYARRNGIDIPKNGIKIDGDTFYSDYPESKPDLIIKTFDFFKYCLENKDFDYIFRPNCGSYLSLPLLKEFIVNNKLPKDNVYLGCPGVHNGVAFVSGSGFLISKNLVKIIVENEDLVNHLSTLHGNHDDVTIGSLLMGEFGVKATPGALRKHVVLSDIIHDDFVIDDKCYHYYFLRSKEPRCFHEIHKRLCK
jgi:hypothetical protein